MSYSDEMQQCSSYNKSIYFNFSATFRVQLYLYSSNHTVCKFTKSTSLSHGKNTVAKNNKIQLKNLVLALRMTIKLCQCGKGVKTKIKKILGVNPSFIGF